MSVEKPDLTNDNDPITGQESSEKEIDPQIIIDYRGTLATKLDWQLDEIADTVSRLGIRSEIKIKDGGGRIQYKYPALDNQIAITLQVMIPGLHRQDNASSYIRPITPGKFEIIINDNLISQNIREGEYVNFDQEFSVAVNKAIKKELIFCALLEDAFRLIIVLYLMLILLRVVTPLAIMGGAIYFMNDLMPDVASTIPAEILEFASMFMAGTISAFALNSGSSQWMWAKRNSEKIFSEFDLLPHTYVQDLIEAGLQAISQTRLVKLLESEK